MPKTTISQFRLIALLEGISFLLLLFIAMPLKYMADMPKAVSIVGMAHGVLFVAYVAWMLMCWKQYKWNFGTLALVFIASLLPFGTFISDKRILARYS